MSRNFAYLAELQRFQPYEGGDIKYLAYGLDFDALKALLQARMEEMSPVDTWQDDSNEYMPMAYRKEMHSSTYCASIRKVTLVC